MGTFYDVLGVRRDSNADEIKQAYHRLALEYHPDKNPSPAAIEKMKEINEAYRVLGDVKLRAEYDAKSFRPADDNPYGRWYGSRSGGFGQGPETAGGYQARPPPRSGGFGQASRRQTAESFGQAPPAWASPDGSTGTGYEAPRRAVVYESVTIFSLSREHLVAAAKMGLVFGIAIAAAFVAFGIGTIQREYGAWVMVAFAAAAAFLTAFVSVLLQRNKLNNKWEAGVVGSVTLTFALYTAVVALAFYIGGAGPEYGWCLTCCALPVFCVVGGWLIGRFVGRGTWDVFRGKRPLR